MKIRIKSVKSKIIVFFIGLAAFQICVMAGFAKLQLEPSIVSMYSEHLERFADVALTETTQETEKIERYMVNIIGDAQIQDFPQSGRGAECRTAAGVVYRTSQPDS